MNATIAHPHRSQLRQGFTLVEILTVIVIIGILAGIAIPAVNRALVTARAAAVRTDINIVEQALEAYKLQYDAYPPDFSSWNDVERHFRKAFPSIADSELRLLAQYTHLDSNFQRVDVTGNADPRGNANYAHYRQCIDPAEALVFCLGGFSSDAKRPFTGEGGPLSLADVASTQSDYVRYQYNTARDNGFLDLSNRLSLAICNVGDFTPDNPIGAGSPFTYSGDEYIAAVTGTDVQSAHSTRAGGTSFAAIRYLLDPFPVYLPNDRVGPLVYFSSRSYTDTFIPTSVSGGWLTAGNGWHALNIYLHPDGEIDSGVARPYLSDQLDTNAGGFLWAQANIFQLVSAGADGSYGGSVVAGVATPTASAGAGFVTLFPSGRFADAGGNLGTGDKYEDPESIYAAEKPQLDNVTNFSTSTLESDLQ